MLVCTYMELLTLYYARRWKVSLNTHLFLTDVRIISYILTLNFDPIPVSLDFIFLFFSFLPMLTLYSSSVLVVSLHLLLRVK